MGKLSCFTAGTKIRLADNTEMPIEKITINQAIKIWECVDRMLCENQEATHYGHNIIGLDFKMIADTFENKEMGEDMISFLVMNFIRDKEGWDYLIKKNTPVIMYDNFWDAIDWELAPSIPYWIDNWRELQLNDELEEYTDMRKWAKELHQHLDKKYKDRKTYTNWSGTEAGTIDEGGSFDMGFIDEDIID